MKSYFISFASNRPKYASQQFLLTAQRHLIVLNLYEKKPWAVVDVFRPKPW
jgi:hypothetical protein